MSELAAGQRARALYDYEARAPDELSFRRNDVIVVRKADEEDDGWYHGELDGKSGLFPNNYVQLITAEKPSGKPPVTLPEYVRCDDFFKFYKLEDVLGRGRFSQVRRAIQSASGESFAVKMMELNNPELGASISDAEREVLAEVVVLHRIKYSGIIVLHETFKWLDKYYLVTEDLQGGDLFDRIEQQGPFSEEDAGPIIFQVTSAVAFLHERGIIHRDIKPDNLVFVSHDADSVRSPCSPADQSS